jgi:hypothetical protein
VERYCVHGNVCSGCVRDGKFVANGATAIGVLGKNIFECCTEVNI